MSFSMSAVVNVAEKSLRSRASVLFTNGAPAANITRGRCARDAGHLAENKCFGHHLREYGDHQVDRELHGPGLLSVPDVMDGRTDRSEHCLDVLERLARTGDDEGQVPRARRSGCR